MLNQFSIRESKVHLLILMGITVLKMDSVLALNQLFHLRTILIEQSKAELLKSEIITHSDKFTVPDCFNFSPLHNILS
jgi:hypothetical protein